MPNQQDELLVQEMFEQHLSKMGIKRGVLSYQLHQDIIYYANEHIQWMWEQYKESMKEDW